MSQVVQSILESGEKIHWEGKRHILSSLLSSFLFVVVFLLFGLFGGDFGPISYIFLVVGVLIPVFVFLNCLVTYYAITDRRVIIKSGLIGADIRSVYYDQIKSAYVNVGLIGKIFSTGTILIDTGRITSTKNGSKTVYDRFANIERPYDIYKILQSFLSDRKEGLHSGRADFENNNPKYKKFIQETEKYKRSA